MRSTLYTHYDYSQLIFVNRFTFYVFSFDSVLEMPHTFHHDGLLYNTVMSWMPMLLLTAAFE